MKQAQFRRLILSLLYGAFCLCLVLTACSQAEMGIPNPSSSPTQVSPMGVTATPPSPRSTQGSSIPGATIPATVPATPTPAWPYNLIDLLGEHAFPSELFVLLSPDGQWLVRDQILLGEPPNLRIISSQENTLTLSEELDRDAGVAPWPLLLSWSPDSRAVVVEGASKPAPCGYDSVIIYQITGQGDVIHNIYHLPDGENGCFSVAWSPDSSQLALFDGADSITINIKDSINENHTSHPLFCCGLIPFYGVC